MIEQIFVSDGVVGGLDNMDFLRRLPAEHTLQCENDPRGARVRERKAGAFVSEHQVDGIEIHVREEYALGQLHRFYVMTGQERRRDVAEFIQFEGLGFGGHE